MIAPSDLVVSLRDVGDDDIHHVRDATIGKNEGFLVTTRAYFKFLSENTLEEKIRHLIGSINFDHDASLSQVSTHIKSLIKRSKIPDSIVYRVIGHYADIGSPHVYAKMNIVSGDHFHKVLDGSASYVLGESTLLDTLRVLWSNVFDPGLISYRNKNGLDHLKTGVVVTVQKS